MSFPISIEALSSEWLSRVLGTTVRSFSAQPLGEGVGILGLVTRVTLDADNFANTLIAKFPSPIVDNRGIADIYNMYWREYVFYTQIAEAVPIRAPSCYHAEFNQDNNDFVILLEDLGDYRVGDQVAGCTAAEAEMVVTSLAQLHASTWQPDQYSDITIHNTEAQAAGMVAGFGAGWPAVKNMFPQIVDDATFNAGLPLADKIPALLDNICAQPLCVAHGDMRLDNIFFADDHIALVDFQAVCRSAPEHDLAYFITQSLSDEVRGSRDWVAFYHSKLTGAGVTYEIDVCRQRYRQCALYLLCYAVVICSALDLANERGRQLGETLLGNSVRSMHELNTFDILENL